MRACACIPFGPHERLLYGVLERQGWSEHTFFALPTEEQNRWLAWEAQRRAQVDAVIERILSDPKPFAEKVTAEALLALLQLR
jgi:hypothetical protein